MQPLITAKMVGTQVRILPPSQAFVAQLAEAPDSRSGQSRFESERRYVRSWQDSVGHVKARLALARYGRVDVGSGGRPPQEPHSCARWGSAS